MKRYRTIVADPPWPIKWSGGAGGNVNYKGAGRRRRHTPLPYATLTVAEIEALPVGAMAEDESHLYLWVTPELNRRGVGYEVATYWGFDVVGEVVWAKSNYGLGYFPRPQHESLLVCRRGSLPFQVCDVGSVQTWAQARATNNGGKIHSAKPDGALDLVERASPGPYLELFARRARFGWDYWGDESLQTVELEEAAS